MTDGLSEELAAYRAGWRAPVPTERQALVDRHVADFAESGIARAALQFGDRAAAIVLRDQHGTSFDVSTRLRNGPVVVTFCRGGCRGIVSV